mmetsp:Transcript_30121/g.99584  ORF Transcript_30121/g.99584 Transcript_30121/m.99584 type:complete len:227 (-) Transcript_30121:3221-3901(-)
MRVISEEQEAELLEELPVIRRRHRGLVAPCGEDHEGHEGEGHDEQRCQAPKEHRPMHPLPVAEDRWLGMHGPTGGARVLVADHGREGNEHQRDEEDAEEGSHGIHERAQNPRVWHTQALAREMFFRIQRRRTDGECHGRHETMQDKLLHRIRLVNAFEPEDANVEGQERQQVEDGSHGLVPPDGQLVEDTQRLNVDDQQPHHDDDNDPRLGLEEESSIHHNSQSHN